MFRIAITGGIACGKTSVGQILSRMGVAVCECDDLAHRLMEPGRETYSRVVAAFDEQILRSDGTIDRNVLGSRVFLDETERERLNAIVHPAVKTEWTQWLRGRDAGSVAAVVIPLLFETHEETGWDATLCVTSSRDIQMQRLLSRGLSETEALRRIAAQMPLSAKVQLSDFVILNNGTMQLLEEQTQRVLKSIMER